MWGGVVLNDGSLRRRSGSKVSSVQFSSDQLILFLLIDADLG
jgi:hypothetical protein